MIFKTDLPHNTIRNIGLSALTFILVVTATIPLLFLEKISRHDKVTIHKTDELLLAIETDHLLDQANELFIDLANGKGEDLFASLTLLDRTIDQANTLLELSALTRGTPLTGKTQDLIKKFIRDIRIYKTAAVNFSSEMKYDPVGDNAAAMRRIAKEARTTATKSLLNFKKEIIADLLASKEQYHSTYKKIKWFSLAVLVVGILLSISIALTMGRALSRPLLELAEATRQISKGDWSARVPEKTDDELGQLAKNFNQMAENITSSQQELKATEKYMENIINVMYTPLLVLSSDYSIKMANPAAGKLLGRKQQELVGMHIERILLTDEFSSFRIVHGSDDEPNTVQAVAKNGEAIPLILSRSAMKDPGTDEDLTILTAQDMRDSELIEALNATNKNLLAEIIDRDRKYGKKR